MSTSTEYEEFNSSIMNYETNTHYTELMCMKVTKYGPNQPTPENLECIVGTGITNESRENLKHVCVMPIGHEGKCCHDLAASMFVKNDLTAKLNASIVKAIYYTPGNDDYVYKNRSSRLYKTALSKKHEKEMRNKAIKKRCAIPLKDASTPILLAQAYLDWVTFVVSIDGIEQYLNTSHPQFESVFNMVQKNKHYLRMYYSLHNRIVFDTSGFTICVITREKCSLDDFADPTRDNRVIIKDTDIQMGHNNPRSESYSSIRGENLVPMSRRGNLIIGEKIFTENIWIDELHRIVSCYPVIAPVIAPVITPTISPAITHVISPAIEHTTH
jgi:hypothetical protein